MNPTTSQSTTLSGDADRVRPSRWRTARRRPAGRGRRTRRAPGRVARWSCRRTALSAQQRDGAERRRRDQGAGTARGCGSGSGTSGAFDRRSLGMVETAIRTRLRGRRPRGPRHPTSGRPDEPGDRRRSSALAAGGRHRRRHAVVDRRRRRWPLRSSPSSPDGPRRPCSSCSWRAGAVVRSDAAWDGLAPDQLGPFAGWADGRRPNPSAYAGGDAGAARGRRRAVRGVGARAGPVSARGRAGGPATVVRVDGRAASRSTPTRAAAGRVAARRRRRSTSTWLGDSGAGGRARRRLQPGAGADRARRRRAARRPGRAGPGAGHRRRPRPAAGDGRAVPRQRAVPPHRRVRAERRLRARRRRPAAAPGPAVGPLGGDGGADRLVRRAHAGRAVGAAGRD